MIGDLKGDVRFTFSAVMGSADTGTAGNVFIVGNSLVGDAKFENKRGTLTIKNAAAYRTVLEGDLVYIQTITDGTGDFAGSHRLTSRPGNIPRRYGWYRQL